jgi:hypothetical protein
MPWTIACMPAAKKNNFLYMCARKKVQAKNKGSIINPTLYLNPSLKFHPISLFVAKTHPPNLVQVEIALKEIQI